MKWSAYSEEKLEEAETAMLKCVQTPYRGFYADVQCSDGKLYKIWTLVFNESSVEIPLLRIHGLLGASAQWLLNFDELSKDRPIYVIDNLGFGKSSRPDFPKDAIKVEELYVEAIEGWRKVVKLNKFMLCGHSMGGFLALSYALKYPYHIEHLILSEPWGMTEKPASGWPSKHVPKSIRFLYYSSFVSNAYFGVRTAGKFGQKIVENECYTLIHSLNAIVNDKKMIAQYLHQCNIRKPSGEVAFATLMDCLFWAKNPMIRRISQLNEQIPITFIYGQKSLIEQVDETAIKQLRPNSYLKINVIMKSGHEVYCSQSKEFNQLIKVACEVIKDT
ncbi:unnamed protein product [Diamesa serratosioi]